MKTPMEKSSKVLCGAKNRQGQPCGKPPMKGKMRCAMHGGKTPKGTKGNRKHGLYSAALSPDEQEAWDEIQVGNVDREIRMAKIMLNRCLELNARINQDPNTMKNMAGLELSEVKSSEEGVSTTSKRPDTLMLIDRYMGRIASLEKTRAELLAVERGGDDSIMDKARQVRDALRAMMEVENDQEWPGSPAEQEAAQADTGDGV
jgi:hypothetical protein